MVGYTHASTAPRWDDNTCWRRALAGIAWLIAAANPVPCAKNIANLKTADLTWSLVYIHNHWFPRTLLLFFFIKTYRWVLSFSVLNLFYLKLVVRVARKCSGREPGSSHGSNGSSSSWTYDSLRIHMYARAINACRCSYIYNGYQFDMTCPCMIYTCVRSYQDQLWLRNGLYITVLLTLLITYLFLYTCGIT